MNIISKLTIRHLLENKKRTIVTILGIVASTALITAILVGIFSFFRFFGNINRLTDGNIHADFDHITWEDIEALQNDDRIELAGTVCTDPTISGIRMMNDKENRFRVGNIFNGGCDAYKQLVNSEFEGRLPETSDEVAVEENFLKDNDLDLHVGDTITFELGNRYEIEPDGTKVYYGGSYRSEEEFESLSTENCTITAILHENRPTKDFDILRGLDYRTPVGIDEKGNSYLHCRITLKKADHTSAVQIRQIAADHNLHISDMNNEFLISVFATKGMGDAYTQLFTLMAIALLIVVCTSVVLIYNAFGMSLTEKIKYLGMLASVGATKAQKRASIFFEGLILGAIGIPLGIAAGIAGAAVTLDVLGRKMLESDMIVGAEGLRGSVPANKSFLNKEYLTKDYRTLFDTLGSVMVVLVEDEDFDRLLEENGLSSDDYHGKELKGVILDSYLHTENAKPVFNKSIIGQKIFYDDPENNPPAVEVGGIVKYKKDSYVCNLVPKNTVDVYVPVSMYYKKAQEHIDRAVLSYTFGVFTTGEAVGLVEKISDITTYGGYSNCVVHDLTQSINAMDTVSLMLNTAMYGFTILLTLIAIANIVNTISTAVHMRRQEFAMFRSVGMEEKGIKKMLLLETILYGIRALVIGIPISILLSLLMFNTIETQVFAFELNYPMYLLMIVTVFIIIGLSMLLSASRIKNDSIIEALKCDVM